jgi:hypothetical protein
MVEKRTFLSVKRSLPKFFVNKETGHESNEGIYPVIFYRMDVGSYQKGGFNNAHSIAMDPVSGDLVCGYHQGYVERFRVLAIKRTVIQKSSNSSEGTGPRSESVD